MGCLSKVAPNYSARYFVRPSMSPFRGFWWVLCLIIPYIVDPLPVRNCDFARMRVVHPVLNKDKISSLAAG